MTVNRLQTNYLNNLKILEKEILKVSGLLKSVFYNEIPYRLKIKVCTDCFKANKDRGASIFLELK